MAALISSVSLIIFLFCQNCPLTFAQSPVVVIYALIETTDRTPNPEIQSTTTPPRSVLDCAVMCMSDDTCQAIDTVIQDGNQLQRFLLNDKTQTVSGVGNPVIGWSKDTVSYFEFSVSQRVMVPIKISSDILSFLVQKSRQKIEIMRPRNSIFWVVNYRTLETKIHMSVELK